MAAIQRTRLNAPDGDAWRTRTSRIRRLASVTHRGAGSTARATSPACWKASP
ncbi:MAG: hypothetical protein MZV70_07000 [Desulfobacterales bacterium]|nr:hypothetical protein [Desulfobacterales bacterium]